MGERTIWAKVAIVGGTGTGKTYMTKTANRTNCGFINVERKPLSYKCEPFKFEGRPKSWASFIKNLTDYINNKEIKNIIIDSQTEALKLLNRECSSNFNGFDIYKAYGRQVFEYIELVKNAEKDIIIFSHDELTVIDKFKKKVMMSYGKEYGDGKMEREFTIVLFTGTRIDKGRPQYFLRTFEEDTSTKTPEGMFSEDFIDTPLEIPNDAKFIFDSLEAYYSK